VAGEHPLLIADTYFLRELFFAIYARVANDAAVALFWGNIIVMAAAVVAVGFIIGSGEYHRKHHGKPRSWRLFAWTFGIGLAIPALALLLGGSA
jgi:hypothetical protein